MKEDDAISRQAAIEAVKFGITYASAINTETGEVKPMFVESNDELQKAINRICELPSVTPKQRTGHWIVHPKGIYAHLVCDKCLTRAPYDCKTNYCPTCGIKMVEPQESEEQA